MKPNAQPWKSVRRGFVAFLVFASASVIGQRSAVAQSLTLDFTINSDINSPTTSATIAANSTYTIDAWIVLSPGASGQPITNLGFVNSALGARSSTTTSEAIAGGTTSSAGANAAVGITAFTLASGFNDSNATGTTIGDWNNDGVNDVSSVSVATTTLKVGTATTFNAFGGGSLGEAFGTGWAFEVGTFTVTTGATIGASGSNTTFTPAVPTFASIYDDWTFTGGSASANSSGVAGSGGTGTQVNNKSTPPDPLIAGTAVTFNVAGGGPATSTTYNLGASTSAANIHVTGSGTAGSQSATITSTVTNVGTGTADTLNFTGLTASSSGTPSPGIAGSSTNGGPLANAGGAGSNSGLTFSASTAGSFTLTPAVGTATNATISGSATLGTTTPTTVNVWNLASPNTITTPVSLGIVHVGESFGTQTLSIQNTAAANVSEGLDASFSGVTGSASNNSGTITTLAAGAAANTTSLSVGLGGNAHTSTPGAVTGTATVALTSDGTGTSGLASTPLTSQAITVNGQVNNFAQPTFSLASGIGTLVENGPTSYTLNLLGNTTGTANLSMTNTSVTPSFQDTLGGSYVTSGVTHYTLGGTTTFSGITAGNAQTGLTVSAGGSSPGTTDILTFNPTSSNTSTQNTALSAITVTIEDVAAGGNTSVLKLSPATLTFNELQNATTGVGQNLSLQETSGTSAATYSGVTSGSFNVTNGASGTVAAGTTNTLATSYTGSTATNGTFTGSYTVTNTSGSSAGQGNLVSNFSVVVGNATTDKAGTGTFTGTVLSASVAAGGSFAELASSSNGGVPAANGALAGVEGSTAQILLGNYTGNVNGFGSGVSATPSMTWRSRMLDETPAIDSVAGTGFVNGSPTSPPLAGGNHPLGLISDVVNLFGMSSGSTLTSTAPVQTDPFVFQMNFNPKTLNAEGSTGNAMASRGNLYLASFIGAVGTGSWENTIIPDFSVNGGGMGTYFGDTIQVGSAAAAAQHAGNSLDALGSFNLPVLESFSAFQTANSITKDNVGNFIGDWGVDTSTDQAWAIVNHNSQFGVVPEPSTIVLAAFGLLGGLWLTSRRKKALAAA